MEVGLWRSRLGDTHPHTGTDVDLDYWPQGTHAVTEEPEVEHRIGELTNALTLSNSKRRCPSMPCPHGSQR